ncbi:hypothetical protein CLOM_g1207 [Closterium sp. NIES-68]|nr:hypothetical protein CLOM_g20225 [Closterium sp. NIES-68]GJP41542.1 hypothetical protein CLOM_g1207 [Closterium sp. NIES-68]GJP65318.1 hypothetical protein CLOP_g22218 [Closterium sp. NIES-67]
MLAWEDEGKESEDEQTEFVLVATAPRDRTELELWSGGADRRMEEKVYARRTKAVAEPAKGASQARRHPKERLICQTSAIVVEPGKIAVRGVAVDTRAQSALMGQRLAEQLKRQGKLEIIGKGMRMMTAEGGPPKWMPCTKEPLEITLLLGEEGETKIRVQCGLLAGMELVYKVGAQICMWEEKMQFRGKY